MTISIESIQSLRNPNCKSCPLYKDAKTVCIMGRSTSKHPKLMLIGESPGYDEDREGKVFVSKAGDLLRSVLKETNIKDYYVTNPIKCHPPNNSKPSVSTINQCVNKYLLKEIQILRPELIVCMGTIASRTLSQDHNIRLEDAREVVWYTKAPFIPGIPFIVTYHPAAALYNPETLEPIIEDMDWALRLINGELPSPKLTKKYVKVNSIYQIPDLDKAKWLDLDLETDGLDPFKKDK